MSMLEVSDARLYFETHGRGPLMLMAPEAGCGANIFKRVTGHLAAHCTVVTYDRRGFPCNQLDGPRD